MRRWMTLWAIALTIVVIGGVAVAAETDVATDGTVAVNDGATDLATDGAADADLERHVDLGALWAKGRGHVTLQALAGSVKMRVAGDVVITGGTDLEIVVDGSPRAAVADDGQIRLSLDDFTGTIEVRGHRFEVEVVGKVALHAKGIGRAVLRGDGVWRTRHAAGTWPVILNNVR